MAMSAQVALSAMLARVCSGYSVRWPLLPPRGFASALARLRSRAHGSIVAAVVAAVVVCGCFSTRHPVAPSSDQPATAPELAAAINTFAAAEPSCLWVEPLPFPHRVVAVEQRRVDGFRSLAQAGLLRETRQGTDSVFSLTTYGASQWTPLSASPGSGNFCYGSRHVASITRIGVADVALFGQAKEVQYETVYIHVPAWAKIAAVRKAFPLLNLELSRSLPHSATVALRDGRWSVVAGPAASVAEPIVSGSSLANGYP